MNGTSGLKVSKDKENSILPVSNRPFVASDSDDFHSETRSMTNKKCSIKNRRDLPTSNLI